jgi:hypothetical protein
MTADVLSSLISSKKNAMIRVVPCTKGDLNLEARHIYDEEE